MKTILCLMMLTAVLALAGCTASGGLSHRLEIYVPATTDVNREFDNRAVVDRVMQRLAEEFGGSSAQEIRGCWVTREGRPVFEKTVICYAYCPEEALTRGSQLLRELAKELRDSLGQESVAIVIDNVMHFL